MKANAGMWIDHREAVIVVLSESREGDVTKRILSSVEKQHTQEAPPDDIIERVETEHLAQYYKSIVSYLRDAGSILIFGPGEAKGELRKSFETHRSETRLIAVETSDNMSEPQIVARVRQHFHQDAKRGI